jgi:hypothetical protein
MSASVAFRWLHPEEILLGRQRFEAGVSRVARKLAQTAQLRAAAIPIPRRRAEAMAYRFVLLSASHAGR